MSILSEIKEKQEELAVLERQYLQETPWFCNQKCSFWRKNQSGCCSWSKLLEDCRDYQPDEIPE